MPTYDDSQVMATLATMSYLAPGKGHEFDGPAEGEAWMLETLRVLLEDEGLATQGEWQVRWVGISVLPGNLAYIVQHVTEDKLAVVVRGTVFDLSCAGIEDVFQDLDVGTLADFTVGDSTVSVSSGSSDAFGSVTTSVSMLEHEPLYWKTVLDALRALVATGKPTIYVTGHSLGGCVTTMLALYLQHALQHCVFQVYTFAAPTAGVDDFATLFDSVFGGDSIDQNSSWRIVNLWDVVPHAWSSLDTVVDDDWYADPGPARTWLVYAVLEAARLLPKWHLYQQPSTNLVPLNADKTVWDSGVETASAADFVQQVYHQHSMIEAYMKLLNAPLGPLAGTKKSLKEPVGAEASVVIAEPGLVHVLAIDAPEAGEGS